MMGGGDGGGSSSNSGGGDPHSLVDRRKRLILTLRVSAEKLDEILSSKLK